MKTFRCLACSVLFLSLLAVPAWSAEKGELEEPDPQPKKKFKITEGETEDEKKEREEKEAKNKEEKKAAKKEEEEKEEALFDFENEETFMDVTEALRSKQYVHRAILSTIVRDTAKVALGSWYLNHMMGLNAVYQPADRGGKSFAKYATGLLGISGGYVTEAGHCLEGGFEVSSVSNLLLGYKYLLRPKGFTFWPFLGAGMAMEVAAFRLSDIPVEAQAYQGATTAGFFTIGAVVPVVDVAIKVEARFNFYGLDRLMLTTGVGALFFL